MLLKHFADFANSRNLLAETAFEKRPIRWIIPLDAEGNLTGYGLIQTQSENNKSKEFLCPKTSKAKNGGGTSEFLVEGATAMFAITTEIDLPDAKLQAKKENNQKKHNGFWNQIQTALEELNLPSLEATLKWKKQNPSIPSFLLFQEDEKSKIQKWFIRSAEGHLIALKNNDNFCFSINSRMLIDDEDLKSYWIHIHQRELDEKEEKSALGVCLVNGHKGVPIAKTHMPKIKNIPAGQVSGSAIVSFDKDSFQSFGQGQSLNAPISTSAVIAYCYGLNKLLEDENYHHRVGNQVFCFWPKTPQSDSLRVFNLLKIADPKSIKNFLKSPFSGIEPQMMNQEKFYATSLSGNGGRIIVCDWLELTLEQIIQNLSKWFQDLNIINFWTDKGNDNSKNEIDTPQDMKLSNSFSIYRLAFTTIKSSESRTNKQIPPNGLISDLYRAALNNSAPSLDLLRVLLHRLKSDLAKNGSKTLGNLSLFALMKLIINRNTKDASLMVQEKLSETCDPAYNCGRLLSILSRSQQMAHEFELKGPGISEKYYGMASSSPAYVLPMLIKLNRHHLEKIKKSDKPLRARYLENQLQDVFIKFNSDEQTQPPNLPKFLNVAEQGRFALGFYQQAAQFKIQQEKNKNTQKEEGEQDE